MWSAHRSSIYVHVCWRPLPFSRLCAWAEAHGSVVDRHGQQKHSVCDACGPYQTIRSRFFEDFDEFVVLMIESLFCANRQTDKTNCFTPCCACMHEIIICPTVMYPTWKPLYKPYYTKFRISCVLEWNHTAEAQSKYIRATAISSIIWPQFYFHNNNVLLLLKALDMWCLHWNWLKLLG